MQDFNPSFGHTADSVLNASSFKVASSDRLTPNLTVAAGRQLPQSSLEYETFQANPQSTNQIGVASNLTSTTAIAPTHSLNSVKSTSNSEDDLTGQGQQTARVGVKQVDALTNRDAGDRFSRATRVQLKNGQLRVRDSLGDGDEADFYRFDLDSRTNFNVTLNRNDGNVEMTLYDRKGRVIAVSNERDGQPEFIRRKLGAGSYVLGIELIDGEVDYTLKTRATELAGLSFRDALVVEPGNGTLLRGIYNYNGSLNVAQGEQFAYYQFTLTQRSTFAGVIENLGVNATIELFNSNRQQIAVFNATNSTAILTQVLVPGDYFFRIRIQTGATPYRLCLCFDEVDLFGNTRDTAILVNFGTNVFLPRNAVGTIDTEDYYRFDLTTPSELNLSLSGLAANADLQLYDSNGVLISSSENLGIAADGLTRNLAAGTYYARVYLAQGGFTFYNLAYDVTALPVFGLNDVNQLVAFKQTDETQSAVPITITGLAEGESMRSIDFRPFTAQLYGLSDRGNLYTINLATGIATQVGTTLAPTLTGTAFDIDFDPTSGFLRVVSDADENILINPITGAIVPDGSNPLSYLPTDANASADPTVTEIAYAGNFFSGPTLYGIDTALGIAVQQGSVGGFPLNANTGSLTTIGTTTIDLKTVTGFDIVTDVWGRSTGYVVTDNGDQAKFYALDMADGEVLQEQSIVLPDLVPVNLISLAAIV